MIRGVIVAVVVVFSVSLPRHFVQSFVVGKAGSTRPTLHRRIGTTMNAFQADQDHNFDDSSPVRNDFDDRHDYNYDRIQLASSPGNQTRYDDANLHDRNHGVAADKCCTNNTVGLSWVDLPTTRQLLSRFGRTTATPFSSKVQLLPVDGNAGSPATVPPATARGTEPDPWVATVAVLLAGIYGTSCVLIGSLSHWEGVQASSYTWPFGIGALYVVWNAAPGVVLASSSTTTTEMSQTASLSKVWTGESILSRIILVLLGLGLMVGGAYDAWMPVYMTGPNVVTAAGIGQDAAVGLFGWSFWQSIRMIISSKNEDSPKENTPYALLLPQVLLLAELYNLGEGSFDELLFSRLFP